MKKRKEGKKIVLIILDGLADKPKNSPLQRARTPNLDILASKSKCGLMWPIKEIAPESGASQFVILGYPLEKFPGRGPLEALGAGLKIKKGAVYMRCNFAKIKGKRIIDIRAKIPKPREIRKINKIDPGIRVVPTIGYRAVMEVKGLSPEIENTHPGYVRYKNFSKAVTRKHVKRECKGHKKSCIRMNKFIDNVEKILKNMTILFRGAGNKLPKIKKMKNWVFIGDMPVEYGLAKLAGMKIIKRGKNEIEQIIKLAKKHNVYVQIKGPDKPAHRGQVKKKIKAIEKIDKMLAPLLKIKNTILCITSDHATPCKLKRHSRDPVPCLIYGKRKTDKVKEFNEKECAKGFRVEGKNLMRMLKEC